MDNQSTQTRPKKCNANVSAYLCRAPIQCSITYGRSWYSVDLPCGITIKVNPKAKLNGVPVLGNNKAVAQVAIERVEGLSPKSTLGKLLTAWLDSTSNETKAWGEEKGFPTRAAWSKAVSK